MQSPEYYDQSPPSWYAIHTRGRHEFKVEEALRVKGHEIFLPRVKWPSRRRDRKVILDLPLFPGYLFIHASFDQKTYLEVIQLKGVVRILGREGTLTPVPPDTIEAIRATITSGRPYYPHRFLKRGTRVRVLEGPLSGITGIILQKREEKRKVVISVELFRRAVEVELEDDAIEPFH